MSGWFTTPSGGKHPGNNISPTKQSYSTSLRTSHQPGTDEGDTLGRPSMQRAVTAPLSTPHDAVLSELTGTPHDVDVAVSPDREQRSDAIPPSTPLNEPVSAASEHPTEDASMAPEPASAQATRSAVATPNQGVPVGTEHVYDPFTGAIAGVLYPRSPDQTTPVDTGATRKKDSLQFDQAKDDLWSHLARIRELQSEIAGMHVNMEGIVSGGEGGRSGPKRPAGPVSRMHTDTIGVSDEWVDAEQEVNAQEKARDAEFTSLAESFEGRRSAIDGIMEKLGDVSKALTTFHALPTPQIDLFFRSNTKDSSVTSPVLRSPSPMFTNPASSPPPGSPPPMSPTSPPPVYGRRGKSMSRSMNVVKTDFGIRNDPLSPMSESPVSDDGKL